MRAYLRAPLLATIPFVLLLNSDRVTVTTEFYGDVSGLRRVQAEGDSSLARQIAEWTAQAAPGSDNDGTRISGDRVLVARSTMHHDLNALGDVEASALSIAQEPLALRTWYRWHEQISIDFLYEDDKERAAAEHTSFEYRLTMPGKIVTATGARIRHNAATWTLKATDARCEITATAVAWRWDLILVLVYVLGYATYRILAAIAHRARLRPMKI